MPSEYNLMELEVTNIYEEILNEFHQHDSICFVKNSIRRFSGPDRAGPIGYVYSICYVTCVDGEWFELMKRAEYAHQTKRLMMAPRVLQRVRPDSSVLRKWIEAFLAKDFFCVFKFTKSGHLQANPLLRMKEALAYDPKNDLENRLYGKLVYFTKGVPCDDNLNFL